MGGAAAVVDVVIVGGGPRAVATVERLDARARAAGRAAVSVTIIDAVEIGAGATWRTDQTRHFLNNTTSDATTIYPDASTPMDGPAGDGPTFVEWARSVAARGEHRVPWAVEEAREVRPDSFPSRRLQGVYYADQLARVSELGGVTVMHLLGTAVDVAPAALPGEPDLRTVRLADGSNLLARTVVLAQGMVQALPTSATVRFTEAAAEHGLLYIAPGMPAEQPWHRVPAGEPVIAQGLGANFFDVVAELTAGRGGAFEPVPGDTRGRLRYHASGTEPEIYAVSRRGIPYRSKGDYVDTVSPAYRAEIATDAWFAAVRGARPHSLDFAAEVWPVLAAELGYAWLRALAARTPDSLAVGLAEARERLIRAAQHDVTAAGERRAPFAVPHIDSALTQLVPDPAHQFIIDELRRPTRGHRVTPDEWEARVAQLVDDELDSLARPLASPRQAVNRAMGALRGPAARLATLGLIAPDSVVRDVHGWFNADGLFLASGPPASRVREVLALIEAGVVRLVGPDTSVSVDAEAGVFRAESAITGTVVTARSLVETRMSKGKVPNTSDPLLRALLGRGAARIHRLAPAQGAPLVDTESLEAVPREATRYPLSLVDAAGSPDPRVLVLGIPASSTQPGSAIGAAPGVPSPLLAGADRAAAELLTRLSEVFAATP